MDVHNVWIYEFSEGTLIRGRVYADTAVLRLFRWYLGTAPGGAREANRGVDAVAARNRHAAALRANSFGPSRTFLAHPAHCGFYLKGIDTEEIIAAVHARRAPMMSASAGLKL